MTTQNVTEAIAALGTGFTDFKAQQASRVRALDDRLDTLSVQVQDVQHRQARLGVGDALEGTRDGRSGPPWFDAKALTGSGSGGYLLPEAHWNRFIDRMRPQSVLIESGIRLIRTEATTLRLPAVLTDPAAVWRGEMESLAGAAPTYGHVSAYPKKLAAYVVASRELFEDSDPALGALLEVQMGQALALGLDKAAFQAQSENNANAPVRLAAVAGIQTAPVATDGAAPTTMTWFHTAWSKYVTANGNLRTAAIYMHPRDWSTLLTIPEASGSNVPLLYHEAKLSTGPMRSLLGVPVYLTSQIPTTEVQGTSDAVCSSAYLVDTSQVAFVMRQDVRIELDHSRHFDVDAIGIRATLRADLIVLNSAGIVHIPGFKAA
ncbi:MAG: phage major capsid protein [Acidobacteria bacterium]|nr:phage major capsid protein [Acidobacteriota bacterium]